MRVVGGSPALDGVCDWETERTETSRGVGGWGAVGVNGERILSLCGDPLILGNISRASSNTEGQALVSFLVSAGGS